MPQLEEAFQHGHQNQGFILGISGLQVPWLHQNHSNGAHRGGLFTEELKQQRQLTEAEDWYFGRIGIKEEFNQE